MKDLIQSFIESLGHQFTYARADFANLHLDTAKGQYVGILYPLKYTDTISPHGMVDARRWEGKLLILTPSHLDDSYPKRYEDYIEPAQRDIEGPFRSYLSSCDIQYTINQWQVEEVVNMLNHNMDGVFITFQATEEYL